MKTILITLVIALSFTVCKADYYRIYLPKLIEHSELIAHVKITDETSDYFEAEIICEIKGTPDSPRITVKKFNNWACAHRWAAYKTGQEELVFLRKDKNGEWEIYGAGDEGEMPVENGKIYYESFIRNHPYLESAKEHRLSLGNIRAVEFELEESIKGITMYLEKQAELEKMTENKTIIDFYSENIFFQRAIDERILRNKKKFTEEELKQRKFGNRG